MFRFKRSISRTIAEVIDSKGRVHTVPLIGDGEVPRPGSIVQPIINSCCRPSGLNLLPAVDGAVFPEYPEPRRISTKSDPGKTSYWVLGGFFGSRGLEFSQRSTSKYLDELTIPYSVDGFVFIKNYTGNETLSTYTGDGRRPVKSILGNNSEQFTGGTLNHITLYFNKGFIVITGLNTVQVSTVVNNVPEGSSYVRRDFGLSPSGIDGFINWYESNGFPKFTGRHRLIELVDYREGNVNDLEDTIELIETRMEIMRKLKNSIIPNLSYLQLLGENILHGVGERSFEYQDKWAEDPRNGYVNLKNQYGSQYEVK